MEDSFTDAVNSSTALIAHRFGNVGCRVEPRPTTARRPQPEDGDTYKPNGQKATCTAPDGTTISYDYTNHGQLSAITIPNEGTIRYSNFQGQGVRSCIDTSAMVA